MRSIARCVLPVLVGPSTAVTLRMRCCDIEAHSAVLLSRSSWRRHCRAMRQDQGPVSKKLRRRKNPAAHVAPAHRNNCQSGQAARAAVSATCMSMQQGDLRFAGRDDLYPLGDERRIAGHGGNRDLIGDRRRWRWGSDAARPRWHRGGHERVSVSTLCPAIGWYFTRQTWAMPGWPLGCCSVTSSALVAQDQVETLLAIENRHAAVAGIGVRAARNTMMALKGRARP